MHDHLLPLKQLMKKYSVNDINTINTQQDLLNSKNIIRLEIENKNIHSKGLVSGIKHFLVIPIAPLTKI